MLPVTSRPQECATRLVGPYGIAAPQLSSPHLNFGPKVKLEDGGQVVHVAGQRAVADKVFCTVAESLSEVLPDIIQAVSERVHEVLSS